MLFKIAEVLFSLFRTNDCKGREWKIHCCKFALSFTWWFGRLHKKNCVKKLAAHAAQLFFLIPSIKSLICGIAVIYWSVYHWNNCLILQISRAVLKYHQEQKSKEVKAEKEESVRLKKIAASISKEIKQFWSSVEKVIMRKCFAGFFLVISTIWEFSVYLNWKMWILLLSVLTGMHFFSIVGRQV